MTHDSLFLVGEWARTRGGMWHRVLTQQGSWWRTLCGQILPLRARMQIGKQQPVQGSANPVCTYCVEGRHRELE